MVDNGGVLSPKTRTQFPIFLDETEYRKGGAKSHRNRMLQGVSTRHRRDIDNVQPYQRGRQSAPKDPLAILRAISDRDKHRDLHATLAVMKTLTVKNLPPDGHMFIRLHFPTPKPLKDGQLLIEHDQAEAVPDIEVGVEPRGQGSDFDVGFEGDDGLLVTVDDLDRILQHVSGIVDSFQRRIKS